MKTCGILVGSDLASEWLLPWWYQHYQETNKYPIAFADFGMTNDAKKWCAERGTLVQPTPPITASPKEAIHPVTAHMWEKRYGEGVWEIRQAWLAKAYALRATPFEKTIWIDIDCQLQGSLTPLFSLLDQCDISLLEDTKENHRAYISDETHYNSGVIAYCSSAPFLQYIPEIITKYEQELPGDEEFIGRLINTTHPSFISLPEIYNWRFDLGENPETVITHFCTGYGKLEIIQSLPPTYFTGVGLPKKTV